MHGALIAPDFLVAEARLMAGCGSGQGSCSAQPLRRKRPNWGVPQPGFGVRCPAAGMNVAPQVAVVAFLVPIGVTAHW